LCCVYLSADEAEIAGLDYAGLHRD